MAAEARRKCSGNLQLLALQEVQWKPPLRQTSTTLAAMAGHFADKSTEMKNFFCFFVFLYKI